MTASLRSARRGSDPPPGTREWEGPLVIKFGVSRLRFRDGSSEDIPAEGVTVVVGANNTGKSVLLREIRDFVTLTTPPPSLGQPEPLWLAGLDIAAHGTEEEFADWFHARSRVAPQNVQYAGKEVLTLPQASMPGHVLTLADAWQYWQALIQAENQRPINIPVHQTFSILTQHLVSLHEAIDRGALLQNAQARDPMTPPTHPYHRLWDDLQEEDDLAELIFRAFGFRVCINRYAQNLQLLVGDPSRVDRTEFPPTRSTLDYYASLPPIDRQGDGVRSFVGLLVGSILTTRSITIIDEPEAFLHPPHARLLGRYLLTHTPSHRQIIVATHSSDIIEGILNDKSTRPVKIIRLDRPSDSHGLYNPLPPARVETLWKDPLLRYSRMLDALFHGA